MREIIARNVALLVIEDWQYVPLKKKKGKKEKRKTKRRKHERLNKLNDCQDPWLADKATSKLYLVSLSCFKSGHWIESSFVKCRSRCLISLDWFESIKEETLRFEPSWTSCSHGVKEFCSLLDWHPWWGNPRAAPTCHGTKRTLQRR